MMNCFINKIYAKFRSGTLNAAENAWLALHGWNIEHGKGKRILLFHGIDQTGYLGFNSRFISVGKFEKYLVYFKQHFNVVALNEYFSLEGSPEPFTIALTFDDGYANVYKYVLPLLEQYRIPATFFVTAIRSIGKDILWTDFFDLATKATDASFVFLGETYKKDWRGVYRSATTNETLKSIAENFGYPEKEQLMKILPDAFRDDAQLTDYWLQLSEEQLIALAKSNYAAIGSHALYHNYLTKIPHEYASRELADSKKYLENITQKEISSIAYPYGAYTRALIDDAESIGYKYQLAADDFLYPEDRADQRLRERMTLNPYISFYNQIAAIPRGRFH